MPTYVYKFVETGETIEVQQAFTDPTLTELAHPADGVVRAVKKVFLPVGITFKGSGFYKTDSRGSSKSSTTPSSTSSSDGAGSSSTSGDSSSSSGTSSTATAGVGSSSSGSAASSD